MNKYVAKVIINLEKDLNILESSLVLSFLKANKYSIETKNISLNQFLLSSQENVSNKILNVFKKNNLTFEFSDLVSLFELIIPPEEKKINGAHYTPDFIIEAILNESLDVDKINSEEQYYICDASCGTGAFFIKIAKKLNYLKGSSFYDIYKNSLYGVDISEESIKKTRILLTLLAFINGEDHDKFEFNLITANSLSLNWAETFKEVFLTKGGFDLVVGNPPYVRSKNIDNKVKESMTKWKSASKGNADLYIPFIELGNKILNNRGRMGYITINTFLHSSNGEKIREYLLDKRLVSKIINFGDLQIFNSATSYTCLLFCTNENNDFISYSLCKEIDNLCKKLSSNKIKYKTLTSGPWTLLEKEHVYNIKMIESIGIPMGKKYSIRNGIATLRNDIYIHKPISEDRNNYVISYNGKEYLIEKAITKKIVKPNVIKNESDMYDKMEILIFPYAKNSNNKYSVISEEFLCNRFPNTYKFLLDQREELAQRDNGNREYAQWFAFGRDQGINIYGRKLFLPYMAKEPIAFKCDEPDVLFYCGYCIMCDNDYELDLLKKILTSNLFWYYIKNVSKDYSNGYKSFAKNYIKNFSIPKLDTKTIKLLLNTEDKQEIEKILCTLYKVSVPSFSEKEKRPTLEIAACR